MYRSSAGSPVPCASPPAAIAALAGFTATGRIVGVNPSPSSQASCTKAMISSTSSGSLMSVLLRTKTIFRRHFSAIRCRNALSLAE